MEKATFEAGVVAQIEQETTRQGAGKLEQLLRSGELLDRPRGRVRLLSAELDLGPRLRGGAVEFAVHADARASVHVVCFPPGDDRPARTLALEPDDRAPAPFKVWRGRVTGLPEGFAYVVRVDGGGPLLDPYAPGLTGGEVWGESDDALAVGVGRRYRGLAPGPLAPARADRPPRPRVVPSDRVIYELHVRGFTRHSSADVSRPGTYAGLAEKIPYFQELGVTTLELLPIFEFDETENPRRNPRSGERLLNFWGYSPVSFFAPKAAYASSAAPGASAVELRQLIDELHRAGIEVVLDVVFNHTAEGASAAGGPLHGWRGLDASAYYLAAPGGAADLDLTGCGNTVHANHPVTQRLILDALRHWAREYGVDGFRFDLAAVFFRGSRGEPLVRSPIAEAIAADPELRDLILIAEPWDATGFRPAAGFPAPWREWDGEFRDEIRRHVGGLASGSVELASRLAGRGPVAARQAPERAVRFVACHDGRPLEDVVAYARKHNEGNGESNRDGWDGEVAWNGGVEGPTTDPALLARRECEVRSLLVLLAAAPGTMQLTAGDERARSQRGNSNAWCRDDEIGWVLWTPHEVAEERSRFVAELIEARRELGLANRPESAALLGPFREPQAAAVTGERAFALLRREVGGGLRLAASNPTSLPVELPLPSPPVGETWSIRLRSAPAATIPGPTGDHPVGTLGLPPRSAVVLSTGPTPGRAPDSERRSSAAPEPRSQLL